MNTKQKLQDLILKYKDQKQYEILVNELCRLYFEVENESKSIIKNSPVGDCLKELENDLITHNELVCLGFHKKTSNTYNKLVTEFITIWYNIQNKEVSIYDFKEKQTIVLHRLYTTSLSLKKLIESLRV